MKEEFVAIRLTEKRGCPYKPGNRYISYIDDCWYDVDKEPVHIFSTNDIEKIKKQLTSHYIYRVGFQHRDGTIDVWDSLAKQPVKQVKTNGLKIKLKL